MNDFIEVITNRVSNQQNTIILGDCNIHMGNLEDNDAIAVNNTMEEMGLEQHISGPTHQLGNTLDLIFTRIMSELKIITQ